MIAVRVLAAAVSIAASVDGPGLRRVPYDASRPPTLVCSTKYGCEVVLAPGEQVRLASLFDDRWTAIVADDGATGTAPRILIDPTIPDQENGHGGREPLRTSLKVLTTGREYVIELQSTGRSEEHRLGFTYRDVPAVVVRVQPQGSPAPQASAQPDGMQAVDPTMMDFGWKATGDPAVRCLGVPFSLAHQVWCKLPGQHPDLPAAYRVDGPKLVPLPFHVVGRRYLVVDAVVWPIQLIVGGTQQHVATITRAPE